LSIKGTRRGSVDIRECEITLPGYTVSAGGHADRLTARAMILIAITSRQCILFPELDKILQAGNDQRESNWAEEEKNSPFARRERQALLIPNLSK
jgi:hypothetical protein